MVYDLVIPFVMLYLFLKKMLDILWYSMIMCFEERLTIL